MAFNTTQAGREAADAGSRVLMACATDLGLEDPDLVATLTFDAVDGAGGMLANALWLLLTSPEVLTSLKQDPSRLGAFWSEATRLAPTILGLERAPIRDVEVDGITIPKGTNVLLLNAVGNRDPEAFAIPNHIDVTRQGPPPLTFGFGARACAGRFLSRLVGEAALSALLKSDRSLTLTDPVDWGPPGQIRTPHVLWCEVRRG